MRGGTDEQKTTKRRPGVVGVCNSGWNDLVRFLLKAGQGNQLSPVVEGGDEMFDHISKVWNSQ